MPRRKICVENVIYNFIRTRKAVTWRQLLNAGISKGALSKYLNKLEKSGIIERTVDSKQKPPVVYYQLSQKPFAQSFAFKVSHDYVFPILIKKLDKTTREKLFKKILEIEFAKMKGLLVMGVVDPETIKENVKLLEYWCETMNKWLSPFLTSFSYDKFIEEWINETDKKRDEFLDFIKSLIDRGILDGKASETQILIKLGKEDFL